MSTRETQNGNLVYRVISACGALGYGYPKESLDEALKGRVDAIISDAGSMDAGPYYLGTGTEYFEREAVKEDYRHMVEAGSKLGVPVILGRWPAATATSTSCSTSPRKSSPSWASRTPRSP
ncbi:MAG: hypothetical protein WDN31_05510 [Hyphomicrobium sp.]